MCYHIKGCGHVVVMVVVTSHSYNHDHNHDESQAQAQLWLQGIDTSYGHKSLSKSMDTGHGNCS